MNHFRLIFVALMFLGLSGCSSDGYQHGTVSGDSRTTVNVLYDSPAVKKMVDQALETERQYHSGLSDPDKRLATFLESSPGKVYAKLRIDMPKEPGYEVSGQTRFKILLESDILPYSKVEFEDGPFKDQVGWLSRAAFVDGRTRFP